MTAMFDNVQSCSACGMSEISLPHLSSSSNTYVHFSKVQPYNDIAPADKCYPFINANKTYKSPDGLWYMCAACKKSPSGRAKYLVSHRNSSNTSNAYTKKLLGLDPTYAQLLSCVNATVNFQTRAYGFASGALIETSILDMPLLQFNQETRTVAIDPPEELAELLSTLRRINPVVQQYLTLSEQEGPTSGLCIIGKDHMELTRYSQNQNRAPNGPSAATFHGLHALTNDSIIALQKPDKHTAFPLGALFKRDSERELALNVHSDGTQHSASETVPCSFEAAVFPMIFPKGIGTRSSSNNQGLHLSDYLRYRMKHMFSIFTMYKPYVPIMYMLLRSHQLLSSMKDRVLEDDIKRYKARHPNATDQEIYKHLYKNSIPSTIVGTPQYFRDELKDLYCKTAKSGMPHFLATWTTDEHSRTCFPEFAKLIEQVKEQCATYNWQDAPVECVRAFKVRFDAFFKEQIIEKKILGKIEDYFIRYEFQGRGSVHAHVLLWVHTSDIDRVANEIVAYVPGGMDATAETLASLTPQEIELRDLVLNKQIHECIKNGTKMPCCAKSKMCSSGYPFKINRIGTKVTYMNGCNKYIYLRPQPTDSNVIPYHPGVLLLWRANFNLQRITGDMWAAYLLKYCTKIEPNAELVINAKLLQSIGVIPPSTSEVTAKIASAHLLAKPVSPCEAAWHLLQFPIIEKTYEVAKVSLQPPNKRTRTYIGKFATATLTSIDHYDGRPAYAPYDSMTFTKYFTKYEPIKPGSKPFDSTGLDRTQNGHYLVPRKPDALVRFTDHDPRISPESFFYRVLLENVPFRCDVTGLISASNTSSTYFQECNIRGIITTITDVEEHCKSYFDRNYEQKYNMQNVITIIIQNYNFVPNNLTHGPIPFPSAQLQAQISQASLVSVIDPKISPPEEKAEFAPLMTNVILTAQQAQFAAEITARTTHGVIFLTGNAGTGKTFLTKYIIHTLRQRMRVLCAAPTGIAATRLSKYATTINKAFDFGRGNGMLNKPWNATKHENMLLVNCDAYVIDEIGMLNKHQSFILGNKVQHATNTFTSMQDALNKKLIIFVGDLCQLPPVCFHSSSLLPNSNVSFCQTCHITQAPLWQYVKTLTLTQPMRQQTDEPLVSFLNKARTQTPTESDIDIFKSRFIDESQAGALIRSWMNTNARNTFCFSIIVTHRFQALNYNTYILKYWFQPEEIHEVKIESYGDEPVPAELSEWLNDPEFHQLNDVAIGCRVMLTENINIGNNRILPNGTICIVGNIDFKQGAVHSIEVLPVNGSSLSNQGGFWIRRGSAYGARNVRYNGTTSFTKTTFPLKLAYALTAHSMQGETLKVPTLIDIHEIFSAGMMYVIMSRVSERSLMYIKGSITSHMFVPIPYPFNGVIRTQPAASAGTS